MKTQEQLIEDKIHFAQWIMFNMWKLLPDGNWANEVMTQYDIVSSNKLHEIYVDVNSGYIDRTSTIFEEDNHIKEYPLTEKDCVKEFTLNEKNIFGDTDKEIEKIRDYPITNFSLDELSLQMANQPIYFELGYEGKLRDTFAGQILQGLICKTDFSVEVSFLVEKSYSIADEMLKQRKVKSDEK